MRKIVATIERATDTLLNILLGKENNEDVLPSFHFLKDHGHLGGVAVVDADHAARVERDVVPGVDVRRSGSPKVKFTGLTQNS